MRSVHMQVSRYSIHVSVPLTRSDKGWLRVLAGALRLSPSEGRSTCEQCGVLHRDKRKAPSPPISTPLSLREKKRRCTEVD